jgi:glucose/arabinose dehydrogenase
MVTHHRAPLSQLHGMALAASGTIIGSAEARCRHNCLCDNKFANLSWLLAVWPAGQSCKRINMYQPGENDSSCLRRYLLGCSFGLLVGGLLPAQVLAQAPAEFTNTLIASVPSPTALAFTPDGRLLIASQLGRLYVYEDGSLVSTPALNLGSTVCTNSERGLLGVAVDPAFQANGFIYLFYSFNRFGGCSFNATTGPVNRVSRFTLSASNQVVAGSELVLIDNILSTGGNHNAGDLQFGRDGYLYVSVGDGGCDYAGNSGCGGANDAARDSHVLLGKILRIAPNGSIPSTNPYRGTDSARCNVTGRTDPGKKCQETYAWGLRNPFRMAFDPNAPGTRFFINDVGQGKWEEINLGQSGADYGWNIREGLCANDSTTNCSNPPAGLTNPIHTYGGTGCSAITGGAFVPDGVWPSTYDDAYLFADYTCGTIFRLEFDGTNYNRTTFVSGLGSSSATAMTFGPFNTTQALYYLTYAGGGQVRRIHYAGSTNRAPTASLTANPKSGALPLLVAFDGRASSDPDGAALTYDWNFGDGTAHATSATVSHSYTTAGQYTVTLTVRDPQGATGTASTTIHAGNRPPTVSITSPTVTSRFRVGQTITLQGTATDPDQGTLPASAMRWSITLHHGSHTHPFMPPTTGNGLTFQAPEPEDLAAAAVNYLEIVLTATDSGGLSTTVSQDLRPRIVNVTFVTEPAGLRVVVNGTNITGPQTVVSWENYALIVDVPAQVDASGLPWVFQSWSDGQPARHTIVTPAGPTQYTARLMPGQPPLPPTSVRIIR